MQHSQYWFTTPINQPLPKLGKLSLMDDIKRHYCGRPGPPLGPGCGGAFGLPFLSPPPGVTLPKQEWQQDGDKTLYQGNWPLRNLLLKPSISLRGLCTGPWISLIEFLLFLTDPLALACLPATGKTLFKWVKVDMYFWISCWHSSCLEELTAEELKKSYFVYYHTDIY